MCVFDIGWVIWLCQLDLFDGQCQVLVDVYVYGCQVVLVVVFFKLMECGEDQLCIVYFQWVVEGDGIVVWVDFFIVVGYVQFVQVGQVLVGEGFVEFDYVEGVDCQVQVLQQFVYCWYWVDVYDLWGDVGVGYVQYLCVWSQVVFFYCFCGGQDQCGGVVVDFGCVVGGDGFFWFVDWFELGQCFQGGVGMWMFVVFDQGVVFVFVNCYWDDFFGEEIGFLCFVGVLLVVQGEGILVGM